MREYFDCMFTYVLISAQMHGLPIPNTPGARPERQLRPFATRCGTGVFYGHRT
eukprot:COSAG05_NODE_19025_length_299_cov_0.670000_1_plen_52_part_10